MSDHIDEIEELLGQAQAMPEGPAQLALLEQAVNVADAHQDVEAGFQTRQILINAAQGAGQPDVMLVAFSWCLAQCDRDPETFPEEPLLWKHRWVVFSLPIFPQVSRSQIEESMADMERRYRRAGSTLRGYHLLRRNVAMRMGDPVMGDQAHAAWRKSPRDWLSDGAANEQDFLVEYLVFRGRYEEALQEAVPLLTGPLRRGYEPTSTYPELLLPLLRLGRPEAALDYHLKGFPLVARKPPQHLLTEFADHLTFLALTENWSRGLRIVEKVLPAALATVSVSLRFDFYLATLLLLERLQEQGKETLKLRLPPAFPLHQEGGKYQLAELAAWFRGQLADMAGRFDARNGNDFFSGRVAELPALKKLAVPCPVPSRRTPGEEAAGE
jgi:hypothetical protein